jgi:hypothetical protein
MKSFRLKQSLWRGVASQPQHTSACSTKDKPKQRESTMATIDDYLNACVGAVEALVHRLEPTHVGVRVWHCLSPSNSAAAEKRSGACVRDRETFQNHSGVRAHNHNHTQWDKHGVDIISGLHDCA